MKRSGWTISLILAATLYILVSIRFFSNADQDENGLLPVRRGDYGVMDSDSAIYQCKAKISKKIIKKSCIVQDFLV